MKKILFITYDFPYPTDSGGKTRAYNLLKFAGEDCEISLFSFTRKEPTEDEMKKIKSLGVKNIYTHRRNNKKNIKSFIGILGNNSIFKNLYFDTKVEDKILSILKNNDIDIVHFESYYTGFYISEKIKELGVKQVLGTENIEHQLYDLYTEKNAAFLTRPVLRREVKKIKKEELSMVRHADATIAVTPSECEFITKHNGAKCTVAENGVDIQYFKNTKKSISQPKILFIGNFSYFPNIDAMQYFYYDIFPNLPKDIMLKVVGKSYKSLEISDKRVEFVEYVEDIRDAYKDVFAMVSPIRIGGGTNFKILESMATRTPVVADPSRVKDLSAVVGKEIMTASTPEEFADKIQLLKDEEKVREKIAQNAFEFVSNKYSWENIGKKVKDLYKTL